MLKMRWESETPYDRPTRPTEKKIMVKYSTKKPLTIIEAQRIAERRSKRSKVRVSKNAANALGHVATGQLVTDQKGVGEHLTLARNQFASAFELAEAERNATERMQAAAQCDPVDSDNLWLVHVDGIVSKLDRERIVELLANGDAEDCENWPFQSDLHLATYYAPLFWNCVAWAGGAEAVRAAGCSVVRATVESLLADDQYDDRRHALMSRRSRRK
jgi:hypothetical protein